MSGRHTLEELLTLDDGPGPGRRVSAAETDAMVEGVLDRWAAPAPGGSGGGAVAGGTGGWWLGGAIAVVAVGGVVLGVLWTPAEAPAPAESPTSESPTMPATRPAGGAGGGPAGVAGGVAGEDPREQAPGASDAADEGLQGESLDFAEPASRTEQRPRRRRPAGEVAPEDLLDRGNRLRREGRWREAEQAYLAAMERSPRSLTAQVAGVAAGSIRLDHRSDPRGAMTLYRRALRAQPRGPLALEAREGLARAARGAGDAATERATLRAILDHHPGTPAADRARRRLGSLGADVPR